MLNEDKMSLDKFVWDYSSFDKLSISFEFCAETVSFMTSIRSYGSLQRPLLPVLIPSFLSSCGKVFFLARMKESILLL